jgi:hypothetical protein
MSDVALCGIDKDFYISPDLTSEIDWSAVQHSSDFSLFGPDDANKEACLLGLELRNEHCAP